MKYLFLKNLSIIKNRTWKVFIGYFILMAIVSIFWKINDLNNDIIGFGNVLGLGLIKHAHILVILTRIFKMAFYIYIVFKVFIDDFIFSTYNTFLRFNRKNWFINKTISIAFIIFIFKILEYIVVTIFFNFNFQVMVDLFIIDLFNFWTIMLIVVFITLIKSKIKILALLVSMVVLIKYLLVNVYDVEIIVFLIIISITYLLSYYNSKNILNN